MSDLFHEKMHFEDIDKIFETIKATPRHYYQILTKREQKLKRYLEKRTVPANVWLGVTVENESVKDRINVLKTIDASIRFLSIEPLLGDMGKLDLSGIHWVIVGGESGPNARPMNPDWPKNIQKQCKEQNVAFFFKQWGTWGEDGKKRSKYANGSLLSGKEWKEEPNVIKHIEEVNHV
jgi:protein gp37